MLLLAAAGCGKSKTAQCNAVIEKLNAVGEDLKKAPDPKDDATAKAYADALTKASGAVKTVETEDAKLVEFRDAYAKNLGETGSKLKLLADSPGEAKPEDVAKITNAKVENDKIVDSINNYCK